MINYSRQIYGLGGFAYPGDYDDDGDGGGDSKVTPSYQPRKMSFR